MNGMDAIPNQISSILLGKEGVGKTTLFNKISKEVSNRPSPWCSCIISTGVVKNNECNLHLIDAPNPNDTGYACWLRCGLTYEALNCIFIVTHVSEAQWSTLGYFWQIEV